MACKVNAVNGEASQLYQSLYRYYRETGLGNDEANKYALADWARVRTPGFQEQHSALVVDPNMEPQLHYGQDGRKFEDIEDDELDIGMQADQVPEYREVVNGEVQPLSAVRAKPSVLNYKRPVRPPIDPVVRLARELTKRFGVPVRFVSPEQAIELYKAEGKEYRGYPSFINKGVAYAVEGRASQTNLIHEVFGHPLLEKLEQEYPHVYNALTNEVMSKPEIVEMIRKEYPEEVESNGIFSEVGKKEMILKALELDAAGKLGDAKALTFKSFIRRFWEAVKKILGITDKEIVLTSISTVGDLTRIVMGEGTMNLAGYAPAGLYNSTTGAVLDITAEGGVISSKDVGDEIQRVMTDGGKVTFDYEKNDYVHTGDPKFKVRRSSEVVEMDFSWKETARTPEEQAERNARIDFTNQGGRPDDSTSVIYDKDKNPVTFKDMKNSKLRAHNNMLAWANLGHALVAKELTHDPEFDKQIRDICATKFGSDGAVIQDAIGDPNTVYGYLYPDPDDPDNHPGAINEFKEQLSIIDLDQETVKMAEHIVYDPEWGIGGRVDQTIIYPDHQLGMIDHKFGDITGGATTQVMRYMDLKHIHAAKANKLNKATLNMVLRAVIMKKGMKSLRWKYFRLAAFSNADHSVQLLKNDALQTYLDGISAWAKELHPEGHAANVAAGIFEADNYYGDTLNTYEFLAERNLIDDENKLEPHNTANKYAAAMGEEMVGLEAQIEAMGEKEQYAERKIKLKKRLAQLTEMFAGLTSRTQTPQDLAKDTDDLPTAMIRDNYSPSDVTQPLIMAVKDMRDTAAQTKEERKVHEAKVHAVYMSELREEKGVSRRTMLGGMPYYVGDGTGFWDFLFVEQELSGDMQGKRIRFISKNLDKEKYNRLRPKEKAYADYVLKRMEETYNRVISRKVMDVRGQWITKAKALRLPEKWDPDNAMLYVPMRSDEAISRTPGLASVFKRIGEVIEESYLRDDFENNTRKGAGLGIKYMIAPDNIKNEKAHSMIGENMFSLFMEHMDHVELMEEVYAASKGIVIMMEYYENQGVKHYKGAIDYLNNYILRHIELKRNSEDILAAKIKSESGKIIVASGSKVLESLRVLTTFTTMSIQPLYAASNFTLITGINFKHATLNLLSQKIFGVKHASFTPKEMLKGYANYTQLVADITNGTQESNKLYQMLKEWKWTPDNHSFAVSKKDMGYVNNYALDPGHLLFMNTIVENMGNISILAALTHSMKVKAGGKEISVYDAYTVEDEIDKESGKKIKVLNWRAGTRGIIEKDMGTIKKQTVVTKLLPEEIGNLKKLSSRITGDYRDDEKGAAEMNALWNMTWQFKRYMKRQLKNMFEKPEWDAALGSYIDEGKTTIDMHTGETVPALKWQRVYTEGWARTAFNGILVSSLLFNPSLFRSVLKRAKMSDEHIDQLIERYRWKNLSDFQKHNVMIACVNTAILLLSLLTIGMYKQDDSFLMRRLKKLVADMQEGLNISDTIRSFSKPWPVVSKVSGILEYGTTLLWSEITQDRTEQGNLRGEKSFMRNFGITSAYLDIQKIIEGR